MPVTTGAEGSGSRRLLSSQREDGMIRWMPISTRSKVSWVADCAAPACCQLSRRRSDSTSTNGFGSTHLEIIGLLSLQDGFRESTAQTESGGSESLPTPWVSLLFPQRRSGRQQS